MAAVLLYFYTAFVILGLLLCPGSKAQNILCPKNCACLGGLVDCSDRDLTELPRDIPAWTEMLDLNSNRISALPHNAFAGLSNLRQLDLSYNILSSLNASIFENLKSLTELKVNWNSLTTMPDFAGKLRNLTVLELSHNTITEIPSSSLEGLTSLKTLDLSYNKITELRDTFPIGNTLQNLLLNNNELTVLESGCFNNLASLETLNLNKNRISVLPKDSFVNMEKLKSLEMSRNKLKEVDGLTFKGLKSLVDLHLKRNRISVLMDGAFYGLDNIENLGLDHNSITSVSRGWLYGLSTLQQLTLSHNRITEMNGWDFCTKLKDLNLSYNELNSIEASVFSELGSLYYLYLDNNKISTIEDEAFKRLNSLQTLELNENELSWNIEDTTGTFLGLESLTKLGLRNNKIRSIQKKAFIGLTQLESLNLSGNKLTSIQKDSFGETPNLKNLFINTSNCLCDCQLSWFPTWVLAKGFQNSVEVQCSHPQELKGISMLEVENVEKAFICDDVPKPQIISQPKPTVALKGDNVTLVCIAQSSSESSMTISWRKNNKDFVKEVGTDENWDINTFASTPNGLVVEITSILKLKLVGDNEEGKYQCIVSNQFGSAYSSKAKLAVYVFPVFTKKPQDLSVKAGVNSQARLECAAKGHPEPEIAWVKDGGTDFPAAKERRMRMMPSDDVFFIMNVQPVDMGLYTCTAQNLAGNITANATLTVLETPSFQERMKDVEVVRGDNAVLKCPANGYPKPRITWTKDNGELDITQRHFFTSENELLVIVDTEDGDAGRYTCEISNALGTERQSATLEVISSPGAAKSKKKGLAFDSDSTTTGIIIIAVVCCVVGTSLVWVIIIYQTRKQREEFGAANTDETTLPPDLPSSTYNTSSQGTLHAESSIHSSPAIVPLPSSSISGCTDNFSSDSESDSLRYDGSVGNTSKMQSRMRTAAIFPSDTESEAQTVPLTSDAQAPAENSGSSTITIPMPSPPMQRRMPGTHQSTFSRGQVPAYNHAISTSQPHIVCVPVKHASFQSTVPTPNISEHNHNQAEYPGHDSLDNAVVTHPYPREEAISPEILDKTIRELFHQSEPPGCDSGLDLSTDISRNHQPSSQRLPRFPKDFETDGQTFPITSASPHLVPSTSPVSHHAPVHTYHSPMDNADCIASMSPHRVLPHRTIDTYLRDPRSTSVLHRLHQDSPSSV
ncbi:uncharacterized protein LOC144434291 isoform X2 [Glandiceps talaboti]